MLTIYKRVEMYNIKHQVDIPVNSNSKVNQLFISSKDTSLTCITDALWLDFKKQL